MKIKNILERIYLYPRYLIEFILAAILILICIAMPMMVSAFMLGKLCYFLGPITSASRRIKENLRLIYPIMDEKMINTLSKQIWYHFGRFIGETPHFLVKSWRLFQKNIKIENYEVVQNLSSRGAILFITSHIGNWWVISKFLESNGLFMNSIYRQPNNPLVKFIWKISKGKKIQKGRQSEMRKLIEAIKSGEHVSIFQDHRERNGERIDFLGQEAATSDYFAKLALRYNLPIVYCSAVREKLNVNKFRLRFKKIEFDSSLKSVELTLLVNDIIGQDIRDNREQWFWLHKRWK